MKLKLIAAVVAMTVAFGAQAQRKSAAPAAAAPAPVYSSGVHEVTALLGFTASALNIGVDYAHMNNGGGFGGYFFMQTEKKVNNVAFVGQTMSFGALYKMVLVDTNRFTGYFSPGFGLTMAKEAGAATAGSPNGTDETLFGASFKMGAQFKVTPAFSLGIERSAYTNWFNDKVSVAAIEYYSVAGTFSF